MPIRRCPGCKRFLPKEATTICPYCQCELDTKNEPPQEGPDVEREESQEAEEAEHTTETGEQLDRENGHYPPRTPEQGASREESGEAPDTGTDEREKPRGDAGHDDDDEWFPDIVRDVKRAFATEE